MFLHREKRNYAYRLLVDYCGDPATDSSTNPHHRPPFGGLPVLGGYFMLPFANSLCYCSRGVSV